jgi:hypothetical protein
MSLIEELLGKIKEHRDAGVTSSSVMYTWLGSGSSRCKNATDFALSTLATQTHLDFLQTLLIKVKLCCE